MRTGVIIAGAIVLALGVVMASVGGAMMGFGDACASVGCDDETTWLASIIGSAVLYMGTLLILAGIGLLIGGILMAPKSRHVPVDGASRPCPSCAQPLSNDARYCAGCGCAVAPILRA